MEVLFEYNTVVPSKVSIILLDWSCRESIHTLHYLNNQTVQREKYEIIWIEYYNRQSKEIEEEVKEYRGSGKFPFVDKWIVMNMPENVCYHKHLMYNIGIIVAKGSIITFCDSDAMVSPAFIKSIIDSFEEENHTVLHMDEVRNNDKRFYPFNYPS